MFAKYYKMSFVWKDSNVLHVLHSLQNFRPATKSYSSVIFRMEPSTLLVWNDPLFFDRRPVLRMREDASCAIDCMHCTVQGRPRG